MKDNKPASTPHPAFGYFLIAVHTGLCIAFLTCVGILLIEGFISVMGWN